MFDQLPNGPDHKELPPNLLGEPYDRWGPIVVGVLAALAIAGTGVAVLVTGRAWLPGRTLHLPLRGALAHAVGIACLGAAGYLHCRYFWESIRPRSAVPHAGKVLSLLAIVGALGFVIIRLGVGI